MGGDKAKVVTIASGEDFSSQTKSLPPTSLVVLYFHAPWAAPCSQMSAVLDALASTYEVTDPPSIKFLSINAEELPDVSEEHDVTAVPYIVLQKGGKTVDTISGSDAATVRAAVEKHAGSGGSTSAGQLPPKQEVTRPETQPIAPTAGVTSNGPTKDLSSYAPKASDPSTAPSFTSNAQSNSNEPEQDLNTRLEQLTKAAPVMLFMKGTPSAPQCGFSRQLVSMLRENSVRYGFFNILADEEVRQGMKEFADWPTFPQLWMGGELVDGLDIVREEIESNPDFFGDYSVAPGQRNKGGPAAAEDQARPTATA